MKPLNFTDPIHIVHGGSAGGAVYQVEKRPRPDLIVLTDNLLTGPCAVDQNQHGDGRVAYCQSQCDKLESPRRKKPSHVVRAQDRLDIVSFGDLAKALAAFPCDRPIVIWSVPTSLSDLLSSWWTFAAIAHLDMDRKRIWLCQPCLEHDPDEDASLYGVGCFPGTAIRRGFERLQPLSAGLLRAGSGLWRTFAGRSPVRFEQACLRQQSFFPELAKLLAYYARLFPLMTRGARPRLSYLDQFILDGLNANDWKCPIDIVKADQERFFFLLNLLNGDLWMPRRLLDWSEHDKADPVVIGRQERAGVNYFTRTSYLLTARGQALRRDGMTRLRDAPRWHVGGCQAYDPDHLWVSLVNKAGIHVNFQEWV